MGVKRNSDFIRTQLWLSRSAMTWNKIKCLQITDPPPRPCEASKQFDEKYVGYVIVDISADRKMSASESIVNIKKCNFVTVTVMSLAANVFEIQSFFISVKQKYTDELSHGIFMKSFFSFLLSEICGILHCL